MKILKEGKQKEPEGIKFTCEKCLCEFICAEDEYWTETSIALTTYPIQYHVYASCPNCHKICHSYKTEKLIECKTTTCDTTTQKPDKWYDSNIVLTKIN